MDRPSETVSYGPVCLRRWRAGDADVAYRVVMESLEHLRPWMPWAADYDHDQAVRFTAQSEEDWASRDAYQYAITSDGVVVGSCGLVRRIGPGGLEIGYWLRPADTGRPRRVRHRGGVAADPARYGRPVTAGTRPRTKEPAWSSWSRCSPNQRTRQPSIAPTSKGTCR